MVNGLTIEKSQRRSVMGCLMDTGRHIDYTIELEDKLAARMQEVERLRAALEEIWNYSGFGEGAEEDFAHCQLIAHAALNQNEVSE